MRHQQCFEFRSVSNEQHSKRDRKKGFFPFCLSIIWKYSNTTMSKIGALQMHFGGIATTRIIGLDSRYLRIEIFKSEKPSGTDSCISVTEVNIPLKVKDKCRNLFFKKKKDEEKSWLNAEYQMSCFPQSTITFGKIFKQFHASLGLSHKFSAFNLKCQQPIIIIMGQFFCCSLSLFWLFQFLSF